MFETNIGLEKNEIINLSIIFHYPDQILKKTIVTNDFWPFHSVG